jgi:hypothetical protein
MGVAWQDAREVLARLLRDHGQEPDQVTSVEAAWQAFRSFLATPVDGLEPGPDSDADGFIVQWGRYAWNDRRPSLTFTRQMAVDVKATWTESDWYQPELWQLNCEMVFDDVPELAGVDQLGMQDTGFDFSPPGPEQDHALREVERMIQQHPALQAMWASTPVRSSLDLENAD